MIGWLVCGSRQKGSLRRQKSELWPRDYPFQSVHCLSYAQSCNHFRVQLAGWSYVFSVSVCVSPPITYHVSNSYITYVDAVWPYFSWLWQFR